MMITIIILKTIKVMIVSNNDDNSNYNNNSNHKSNAVDNNLIYKNEN